MKDWFKARKSWYGMTAGLSSAESGRLWNAVLKYVNTGEIDNLTGSEKGCFSMIIWTLQQDEKQERELSVKRKQSGHLGGIKRREPNGSNCKQMQANASFASPHTPLSNDNDNGNNGDNNIYTPFDPDLEDTLLSKDTMLPPTPRENPNGYNDGMDRMTQALDAMPEIPSSSASNPVAYAKEKLDIEMSGTVLDDFTFYEEKLPEDVIRHAIDKTLVTVGRNSRNSNPYAFLERVLFKYVEDGVDSMESARESDAKFVNERRKRHGNSGRGQQVYQNPAARVTRDVQQAYDDYLKPTYL